MIVLRPSVIKIQAESAIEGQKMRWLALGRPATWRRITKKQAPFPTLIDTHERRFVALIPQFPGKIHRKEQIPDADRKISQNFQKYYLTRMV